MSLDKLQQIENASRANLHWLKSAQLTKITDCSVAMMCASDRAHDVITLIEILKEVDKIIRDPVCSSQKALYRWEHQLSRIDSPSKDGQR